MMGNPSQFNYVKHNFDTILQQIEDCCVKSGRKNKEITLMGVTKTVPADIINVALDAGLSLIGENRAQELLAKHEHLNLDGKKVHFIGGLQTNKVRQIVDKVDMIQSVDRTRLAAVISREWTKTGRDEKFPVLVEVNICGEQSKEGTDPKKLVSLLEEISILGNIEVKGLMTIPPIFDTESEKRKVFSKMYKLFVDIKGKNIDNVSMDILSMGMSNDYKEAILEGSTLVRVGSALFGKR